jgi:hypothetical protein
MAQLTRVPDVILTKCCKRRATLLKVIGVRDNGSIRRRGAGRDLLYIYIKEGTEMFEISLPVFLWLIGMFFLLGVGLVTEFLSAMLAREGL